MAKKTYICTACGSTDVLRDAYASWDVEKQQWALHSVFDNAECERCDGETSIEDVDYARVRVCDHCDNEFHVDWLNRLDDGDRICDACNKGRVE